MQRLQRPTRRQTTRQWPAFELFVLLAACCLPQVSRAASDEDPLAALRVRANSEARRLAADAARQYQQVQPAVERITKAKESHSLSSSDARQMSELYRATLRLQRVADKLQWLGEAAGYDYRHRARDLGRQLLEAAEAYGKTNTVDRRAIAANMIRARQNGIPRLPAIQSALQREQYDEAETALYAVLDELDGLRIWIGGSVAEYYQPFSNAKNQLDKGQEFQWRQRCIEQAVAAAQDKAPDFAAARQVVDDAINSLDASGQCEWLGAAVDGPTLVVGFRQHWEEVQVGALQARALYALRGEINKGSPREEEAQLQRDFAEFSSFMLSSTARLVERHAQTARPANPRQVYLEYQENITDLLVRQPQAPIPAEIFTALREFSRLSPELAEEVDQYAAATDEVIRWRRRIAAAQADTRKIEYTALAQIYSKSAATTPQWIGLLPADAASIRISAMLNAAPLIVPRIAGEMIQQKVRSGDFSGDRQAASGRLEHRCYVELTIPQSANLQRAIDRLKADLRTDSTQPPLTIEAAVQIARAENSGYVQAGGRIVHLELQPLLPTFADLSSLSRTPFLRLGEMPDESEQIDLRSHVLTRFELIPDWVHHDGFFVELETAP